MEPGNQALNLLQQIITVAERQTITIANYLNYISEINPNPSPKVARIIEGEQEKLIEHINYLEQLQTKFAELLNHLQGMQDDYLTMHKKLTFYHHKIENLELINKDVIYWKNKSSFYQGSLKIVFNEYKKLKDGQENHQHRGC